MKRQGVIVIGAGGHARVCIELLFAMGYQVAYCVGGDASPPLCGGVPVLEGDEHLACLRAEGYYRLFVAIGANPLRESLAKVAVGHGYQLVNAISPQAIISSSVKLGAGIAIMAGAVINAEACISDLAIINTSAVVDHNCQIASAVHIAPQCGLAGNVVVGRQSFLGIGCKVIPNVVIGDNVTIGAGCVVLSDIDNNHTAVGVPARIISK